MSILSLRKPRGKRGTKSDCRGALIESELLPRLFDIQHPNTEIHVLDVGTGVSNTLEFLQTFRSEEYRCKVYFLDLAPAIDAGDMKAIGHLFDEYSGELFDACLFWDLLHRLEPSQLAALSDALEPYIYSGTRAHTIANLANMTERYLLRGRDQLEIDIGAAHRYPMRSLTQLGQQFPCLPVLEDRFRDDGRLETLLGTN